MTANSLNLSTSPYLLLHQDNPVAWRQWSPAVLEEAKAQGKPIFLTTGYTGCHWCHVMNQESFADPQTAAFLNENFIPVIADREERPDLDQVYQAASNLMGHAGGWPLNIFLTDEGKPFFVSGFLPREERLGQPPFMRVLADMAASYRDKNDEMRRNAETINAQLDNLFNRDMRAPLESIQLNIAAMRIGQRYDIFLGGMTGQMKFPTVGLLDVLWRAYLRSGAPQFMQLVALTMDNMAAGGLYDHVGGGFFRYTTDEGWLVPHFEKMLPDNALLIGFMTGMWQFNRNELCRLRVAETIDWLMREMRLEGGFAAGLDALSEGEEGKYYLWSEAEIDAALMGTFSARFKQVYGVSRDGNLNGKTLLRRLGNLPNPPLTDADEALLSKQRALLLAARGRRVPPARDEKLLADWNGLAIKALAFAGSAFDRADWLQAAVSAFDAVVGLLGEGDLLYHAWAGGTRGAPGFADDYANMAAAALQLFESTGDRRFLDAARRWVATLDSAFWDESRAGYYFASHAAERLIVRPRMIFDQPQPAANSTMIMVLTQLALLTGENDYGIKAQSLLVGFAGECNRAWISCGAYLSGYECFAAGLQLVVVGPPGSPRTQELVRTIWGKALPDRLLLVVDEGAALSASHPAFGKGMQNGQPTAYICQRNNCSAPITSAVTLSQTLSLPQQRQT